MNKAQYEALQPYAKLWIHYKKDGTAALTWEDKKTLGEISHQVTRHKHDLHCPVCVQEMFENIMKRYDEFTAENNLNASSEVPAINQKVHIKSKANVNHKQPAKPIEGGTGEPESLNPAPKVEPEPEPVTAIEPDQTDTTVADQVNTEDSEVPPVSAE